jgi:hypothetical protein
MVEFGMKWILLDYDTYNRREKEWELNLTRVIDELNIWCKDHGIANYATGFTQIELCITFGVRAEAMLFKLRWHDACTA